VGPAMIKGADKSGNMATPLLAQYLGGGAGSMGDTLLMAIIAAVAFATILAVVAGLTLTASASFAHDFYAGVLRRGASNEQSEVKVARMTALVLGVISVALAIGMQKVNLAFLVGVVFALAASRSSCCPCTGSASTPPEPSPASWWGWCPVALSPTVIGPHGLFLHQVTPPFPLANPGLVSIPLAFLSAIVATLCTAREEQQPGFADLRLRALTGFGAAESGRP
jgi:cation/acetate symporter